MLISIMIIARELYCNIYYSCANTGGNYIVVEATVIILLKS